MKKIEDKDKQGKLVMGQAQHEIVADIDYEGVVAIKQIQLWQIQHPNPTKIIKLL